MFFLLMSVVGALLGSAGSVAIGSPQTCADGSTATLSFAQACVPLVAGQHYECGRVCVTPLAGDAHVAVTYTLDAGWELNEAHLWLGEAASGYPATKKGKAIPGQFPHKVEGVAVSEWSLDVDLVAEGMLSFAVGPCTYCGLSPEYWPALFALAHASVVLRDANGDVIQAETAWSDGSKVVPKGDWAMISEWPTHVQCGPAPTGDVCANSTCFLDLDLDDDGEGDFSRWGWTQQFAAADSFAISLQLWAAAGQCSLDAGTQTGEALVEYNAATGDWTVTLTAAEGFDLEEWHVYVGCDVLPRNGLRYTVAPGSYPYVEEFSVPLTEVTTSERLAEACDSFHVVVHANVCGDAIGGCETAFVKAAPCV